MRLAPLLGLVPIFLYACSSSDPSPSGMADATTDGADAAFPDTGPAFDAPPPLDGPGGFDVNGVDAAIAHPCSLPGSIQHTASGVVVVPGGNGPDLSYLQVPTGFCVHYYGAVNNARQLRFAPGGELFVASPTTSTTGGGPGGMSAIAILPDDDHDGVADSVLTYMSALPSTQGLLFAGGYLYYQDATEIMRVPYTVHDRMPSGASEEVADVTIYTSIAHWPKTLDIADDGTMYVGNGGDQDDSCDPLHPFHGGVLQLDGTPGGTPVAKGFRNPIAIRCARGHNQCFAVELAKDGTIAPDFGREKVVPIRSGDDWGFPCCATQNQPYASNPGANCATVAQEPVSFAIGHTPFGLDFEPGMWPAPWTGDAIVTMHGEYGTWTAARLVAIAMDPTTGLMETGSDLTGSDTGSVTDFATGWDDNLRDHGRPASLAFSGDGRLFLGNDVDGTIVWIAPLSL